MSLEKDKIEYWSILVVNSKALVATLKLLKRKSLKITKASNKKGSGYERRRSSRSSELKTNRLNAKN